MKGERPCVYMIANAEDIENIVVKIGVTTNIRRRLNQIKTGCPIKINFVHQNRYGSIEQARKVERAMHIILGNNRLRGEWFKVSIHELERADSATWELIEPIHSAHRKDLCEE